MRVFKVSRGGETYYRVDLPQRLCPDGKRRSVMAKTRNQAFDKAHEELGRWESGLNLDAGEKTVGQFMSEFLCYYKSDGGIALSTLEDYRYHIDSNIVPALGRVKLRELDPRKVDQFLRSLNEKGFSPSTVQYAYSVLRRALQFAVDWKYIPVNPASSRMRAAKRRTARQLSKIRFLTAEESRTFIAATRGRLHEALYVLAITTGMRPGEMLGLQWPDIDLSAGKLTIFRALQRIKCRLDREPGMPGYILAQPKTAGSRRTLDIPPVTVEALRQHQAEQRQQRLLAGSRWTEQRFVFTTRTGSPIDISNILHRFQEILKDAGLPKLRFYDLRHTHASLLIAEGVHPKKIAERLGHASIKLTMDLYGHLFEGSDKESAERMQRIFGESCKKSQPVSADNVVELRARRNRG
jgi:integrase